MASRGNMIGLVELADADTLLNQHGTKSFKDLQEVFDVYDDVTEKSEEENQSDKLASAKAMLSLD